MVVRAYGASGLDVDVLGAGAGAGVGAGVGAVPRAGRRRRATIRAQVAGSSTPVTLTLLADCQVRSAAAVLGPNTPSGVAPMTFCARATSGPVDPWARVG